MTCILIGGGLLYDVAQNLQISPPEIIFDSRRIFSQAIVREHLRNISFFGQKNLSAGRKIVSPAGAFLQ